MVIYLELFSTVLLIMMCLGFYSIYKSQYRPLDKILSNIELNNASCQHYLVQYFNRHNCTFKQPDIVHSYSTVIELIKFEARQSNLNTGQLCNNTSSELVLQLSMHRSLPFFQPKAPKTLMISEICLENVCQQNLLSASSSETRDNTRDTKEINDESTIKENLKRFDTQCMTHDGTEHRYQTHLVQVTKKGKRRSYFIDGSKASKKKIIDLIKGYYEH